MKFKPYKYLGYKEQIKVMDNHFKSIMAAFGKAKPLFVENAKDGYSEYHFYKSLLTTKTITRIIPEKELIKRPGGILEYATNFLAGDIYPVIAWDYIEIDYKDKMVCIQYYEYSRLLFIERDNPITVFNQRIENAFYGKGLFKSQVKALNNAFKTIGLKFLFVSPDIKAILRSELDIECLIDGKPSSVEYAIYRERERLRAEHRYDKTGVVTV